MTTTTDETPSAGKLLVVDDEATVLKLVKTILTRAHYQVATCGSASEALRLITQGNFDLVITDAIMPSMSGYELVQTLRRHPQFSEMPVLMLTRKRQTEDVKKAMTAGVTDYVIKPIDEQLLLDKVGQCVRKGKAREVFETAVAGAEGKAEVSFDSRIISVSETGLVLRLPFALSSEAPFRFTSPLFAEMGVREPLLRLISCEQERQDDVPDFKGLPFVARLAFVGLPETELQKIRAWSQRQEIRRRK